MRPKKISIGDLRDVVQVYRTETTGRTPTGGLQTNRVLQREVLVNVQSKTKSRETGEGSVQYYREYKIIARPGAFDEGDLLYFGLERISVTAISDANTGMIEGAGISVKE